MTMPTPTFDALRLPLRARMVHTILEQGVSELVLDDALDFTLIRLREIELSPSRTLVEEALTLLARVRDVQDDPFNVGRYVDGIPHGKIQLNAEAFVDDGRERYRGLIARIVAR